jgi:hypothetical protein
LGIRAQRGLGPGSDYSPHPGADGENIAPELSRSIVISYNLTSAFVRMRSFSFVWPLFDW